MQLLSKTGNKIIALDVMMADSFLGRLRGLLGRKSIKEEQCMMIVPCNSIHTFFMKFPIDAVFVDKDHKVVLIIHDIHPGRISPLVKTAHAVIEMQSGKAVREGISIGDVLQICND